MTGGPNSYQRASFKGSHNSYQRKEDLHEQIYWDFQSPAQGGCRAVEIDIARHSDASGGSSASYFQVTHDQGGTGAPLAAWLGYLLSFHVNNPGHDPIFVTLDIKSSVGNLAVFPAEIDAYLRAWFEADAIATPASIMADQRISLLRNVAVDGWPDVSALAGKFLFCLSGTEDWKSTYAATDPLARLCFADFDISDTSAAWSAPADGHRAIANLNLFTNHKAVWSKSVPQMRQDGLLVRGYVLDGEALWKHALSVGVNILATDEISGTSWAAVGGAPFVFN